MEPLTMAILGSMLLGAVKGKRNEDFNERQNKFRAEAIRYSPWTKMGDPGASNQPGMFESMASGAATGAMLGSMLGGGGAAGAAGGAGEAGLSSAELAAGKGDINALNALTAKQTAANAAMMTPAVAAAPAPGSAVMGPDLSAAVQGKWTGMAAGPGMTPSLMTSAPISMGPLNAYDKAALSELPYMPAGQGRGILRY